MTTSKRREPLVDLPADPTTRFTDRVADYSGSRPCYPDRLVQAVVEATGIGHDAVIADIGSGTGLSAEPFLRHGYVVICVEPNAAMRASAEKVLGSHAGFRSVEGSAEATGLADGSVDAVLVAQAFHWFDVEDARREFLRILRPEGWVCLAWNTRHTTGSSFLIGYEKLLRTFGTDYERVQQRTERLRRGDGTGPGALESFFRGGYTRRVLANRQDLDLAGLESRVRSSSYTPAPGSPAHAPMMDAVAALFRAVSIDGLVRIEYDLEVYIGRL